MKYVENVEGKITTVTHLYFFEGEKCIPKVPLFRRQLHLINIICKAILQYTY